MHRRYGWIASEIIRAKDDYKYDFILLEATTPGNSSVEISVLDATEEASVIGFANETISPHEKVEGTYLSIDGIDPTLYPEIRIQVNLVENGTHRPTLQAWSLYFVPKDEWRDEFLSDGKMSDHRGLNFTDDKLTVNLTSKSGGGSVAEYDPFPTVAGAGSGSIGAFFSNAGEIAYENMALVSSGTTYSIDFGDFDNDGDLDVIKGAASSGSSNILWTQADGKFSTAGAFTINTNTVWDVTTGDYNGDGWADFAMALRNPQRCSVWLNKGDGTFNNPPDIVTAIEGQYADSGDLNNDGYDDLLFTTTSGFNVLYGGANGPDTTVDIIKVVTNRGGSICDVDVDGYLDIISWGADVNIFLGESDGPDSTADYALENTAHTGRGGVGDVNGDGYVDIVVGVSTQSIRIFKGSDTGWSASDAHNFNCDGNSNPLVADVDKDGYADILVTPNNNKLDVFLGGDTWPTVRDIRATGFIIRASIAVPQGSGSGTRAYRGTFITEAITISSDQWKWDMLALEGTTPKNSSMAISVLDGAGTPITGYEDLADWNIDLLGINAGIYPTIRVKVDIRSELNNTTPILEKLTIKWMDKWAWRDQFYGDARSERLMGVDVMGGSLQADDAAWISPQLVLSSLRDDAGYNSKSQAYVDVGGLDFLSRDPWEFPTKGTAAFDVADVDGNGFPDIVFAVHQTSDTNFVAKSPLFLNSVTGWRPSPDHEFPTVGASDILLEDLNGDGHMDVVISQEMIASGDYSINSTLFWGSASGWNDTADVEFITRGASGVVAVDLDDDDDLDLVFSCFKDVSTATDSLVFTQGPDGFNGTSPSLYLPTKAARAVAVGDLDKDSYPDLVFANSFSGGLAEIDSYIYWGTSSGFDTTPTGLPTVGVEDVKVADLDGDGHLDIVFANSADNAQSREVSSYVYLNDGSGGFSSSPDATLPVTGAVAVAVGDLDGTGWKDLVFACQYSGSNYSIPSCVYLGGSSGWSSSPDFLLPTDGASDAMIVQLTKVGSGGYISKAITPDASDDPGSFGTFRYTATMGASQSGKVQLVDALTEEVLAETSVLSGTNEWSVAGLFRYVEHKSIRAVIIGEGLDKPGAFEVDDIWLNWTKRVKAPPEVISLQMDNPTLFRTNTGIVTVEVQDEYNLLSDLSVMVQYRMNGTVDWDNSLFRSLTFDNGVWTRNFVPRVDTPVGSYDFRVSVRDMDGMDSGFIEFPNVVEVLNNIPSVPQINLIPARADTTSTLQVEIVRGSQDVESTGMTYRYLWYLDGEFQSLLVTDSIDPTLTEKGQNWSVKVMAYDGLDESPPALAWRVIENAAPRMHNALVEVVMDEDTVDTDWIDLSTAFEDPDGDALTWTLNPTPDHIGVEIDPATGKVTITLEENWNGEENLTFVASDGELQASQTVTVTVTPVNDIPRFATVNGKAVGDGPIEMSIKQGGLLSIDVLVLDEEGDDLVFDTNSTLIDLDGTTGSIRWTPDNDMVGILRFSLTVWDTVTPSETWRWRTRTTR